MLLENYNILMLIGFGMSFTEVDTLSQSHFEATKNDDRRLSAALEIAIRKEIEKGHTYTIQADLHPHLTKLLKDKELVAKAFKAGHDKAQYLLNHTTGTYHPTAQLLMENVVAKRLKALTSQNCLYDEYANSAYCSAVGELPYELTKKQIEAVTTCLNNAVSCITGGAGTGTAFCGEGVVDTAAAFSSVSAASTAATTSTPTSASSFTSATVATADLRMMMM